MQALSFYWPFIKLGATDVWRHKTRSFLTMLGMVFGVGSVIAMLAVGEGASHQALESIKRLGSQNIMVNSVKPTSEEGTSSAAQSAARLAIYGLLHDDEARIRETIHPYGFTFKAPSAMTASPTDDQLKAKANWALKYDAKAVPFVVAKVQL